MTTTPACSLCKFSVREDRPAWTGETYVCRRFPPLVRVDQKSSCARWTEPGFPPVQKDDWCGEFQVATVTPAVQGGNWERFPDGELKPFLEPGTYDELRYDDKFLYNRGPKPDGLT